MEQGQRTRGADRIGLMHPDEVEGEVRPGQHDRRIVPVRDGRQGRGGALPLQRDQLAELVRGGWRRFRWSQLVAGGQQPGAPQTRRASGLSCCARPATRAGNARPCSRQGPNRARPVA